MEQEGSRKKRAGRGKRKLGVCVGDPPPPYPARIVYRRQSRDEVRSVLWHFTVFGALVGYLSTPGGGARAMSSVGEPLMGTGEQSLGKCFGTPECSFWSISEQREGARCLGEHAKPRIPAGTAGLPHPLMRTGSAALTFTLSCCSSPPQTKGLGLCKTMTYVIKGTPICPMFIQ